MDKDFEETVMMWYEMRDKKCTENTDDASDIPNKPCKYGVKIMTLTDAKTHYIYAGKDSDSNSLTVHEQSLAKPKTSADSTM